MEKSKGLNHAGDTTYKTQDSLCKGLSKYKNRHTMTYYRQKLGGGWKYRIGTGSDTCQ